MVEKQGQKIRAGVSPPPLFGQCPKENIFFFVRASLIYVCDRIPDSESLIEIKILKYLWFARCSVDSKRAGEVLEETEVDNGGVEFCCKR